MRFHLFLAAALIAAARAPATSQRDHVNSTQATDTNPRSGSVAIRSPARSISPTSSRSTWARRSPRRTALPRLCPTVRQRRRPLLNLGLDWTPAESITVGLSGEWSPQVTEFADAPLALATTTGTAHIRSLSSEVGGGLDLAYDTERRVRARMVVLRRRPFHALGHRPDIPRVSAANGALLTTAQVRMKSIPSARAIRR